MIEEFLKSINLSEDRFFTKNKYSDNYSDNSLICNGFGKRDFYGDFNFVIHDNLKKIEIINDNFFIVSLYNENTHKIDAYKIDGVYKDFVYSYIIVEPSCSLYDHRKITIKIVKNNYSISILDIVTNYERDLIRYDFPFETKFNDFEFNHKNVLNSLEEKINSGELKHT